VHCVRAEEDAIGFGSGAGSEPDVPFLGAQ
jgi:hypothetical protein